MKAAEPIQKENSLAPEAEGSRARDIRYGK